MVDRKSLLFSAVLLIAGIVVYWMAQQFHEERGVTPNEVFTAYANSTSWVLVHAVQFAVVIASTERIPGPSAT